VHTLSASGDGNKIEAVVKEAATSSEFRV